MSYRTLESRDFFRRSDFDEEFSGRMTAVDRWRLLADRFDSFLTSSRPAPSLAAIPRTIHQIWLGGSLPRKYRRWTQSWRAHNRGWEYVLWDENAILKLGLVNERAFRESLSFGARSDLARYEILRRHGGVYADTDFECVASFDTLVQRCTFFAGTLFDPSPQINNALIGSAPGHPILDRVLDGLSQPVLTRDPIEILDSCGANYLTKVIFEHLSMLPLSDVVLPSTYFYPLPHFAPRTRSAAELRDRHVREWSLAVHYWETSWIPQHPLRAFVGRLRKALRNHLNGRRVARK